MFDSIRDFSERLRRTGYFIDPAMTQVVFLAIKLHKPLLLEGLAGSGNATSWSLLIVLSSPIRPRLIHRFPQQKQRSMQNAS
jgi:hypothetical protein